VLWRPLRFVIPTPTALYFNRHYMRGAVTTHTLQSESWAQDEAKGLLARSEERLRGLESKGPGLVTVSAIVTAGVGAAIIEADGEATLGGKLLLSRPAAPQPDRDQQLRHPDTLQPHQAVASTARQA
jgi:hypothetical protein